MSRLQAVFHAIILLPVLYLMAEPVSSAQITTPENVKISRRELNRFIKRQVDSLQVTGLSVAIIQKGKVVYYRTLGEKNIESHEKAGRRTLFEAASMTKPVFAYAVHKLAAEGFFDIDTPLFRYATYDDLEYDRRYRLITGRMVLGHATGLPNWRPEGERLFFKSEPGSMYTYSGEGYEFLGYAVSRHTGRQLEEIISEQVFVPLKMKHSFMTDNDYIRRHMSTGHTDNKVSGRKILDQSYVAYGLRTEARDYARFVIELIRESHQPKSIFESMASPHINIDDKVVSCLGIRSEQTPYGAKYFHSGNNGNRFQSHFAFYKEHDTGFVFFMNCNRGVEFAVVMNKLITGAK
jgi:CubicO group peptidase (beta-lactamase class C family)